ncbi:heterokaryon incompatibility protein-domain-containing protein [Podospora conica]|nr:heterokaryon incompatibility protein-domain-containing protein [Schizothecium conicum]
MRLLNVRTLRLEYFQDADTAPKYAILSHTWGKDEILFEDLDPAKNPEEGKLATTKPGLEKVLGAAREAFSNDYDYIWIDTCCIDKSSSAELSEAINSMFNWYAMAGECYAYLSDFTIEDEARRPWNRSRWFERGWTLQELIAPSSVIFFDSRWKRIGTRAELAPKVAARTKIPVDILNIQPGPFYNNRDHSIVLRENLESFSVSARMLWAAGRQTTRVEDRAYSLMGIFDVNMPLLYGEGSKAFQRLQEIILTQTDDQSILAFVPFFEQTYALAERPGQFVPGLENYQHIPTIEAMTLVSKNIEADVLLAPLDLPKDDEVFWESNYNPSTERYYLAILHCNVDGNVLERVAIMLKAINTDANTFARVIDDALGRSSSNLPVCFKLQLRGGGKTWAVPINSQENYIGYTRNRRREGFTFPIVDFVRAHIVIKPSTAGRQGEQMLLQISLSGQLHSEGLYFVDELWCRYETQNDYIRIHPVRQDLGLVTTRNLNQVFTDASHAWGVVATGYVFLTKRPLTDQVGAVIIIWGYKFPPSNETYSPREDQMVCYVSSFPMDAWREEDQANEAISKLVSDEFAPKAARVSSCWNEQLNRGITAEIWTQTVIDRTCSFLKVNVDGSGPSDVGKERHEGKESDKGKESDETRL